MLVLSSPVGCRRNQMDEMKWYEVTAAVVIVVIMLVPVAVFAFRRRG
jgi:hypothetical protein